MMDAEPSELRSLGFASIFRATFRIIFEWKALFVLITIVLVTPLSFLYLSHSFVMDIVVARIYGDERALDSIPPSSPMARTLEGRMFSNVMALISLHVAYLVFLLFFGLLATCAVTYSVACAYVSRDMTFCKVMKVVPTVWKRIFVTVTWSILLIVAVDVVATPVLNWADYVMEWAIGSGGALLLALAVVGKFVVALLIIAGTVLVNMVFHLASVVSVMEEEYGLAAIRKSGNLIKGRAWLAFRVYLALHVPFMLLENAWKSVLQVDDAAVRMGMKEACGLLIMVLIISPPILVGLAAATVGYFVCKAYHDEGIDKAALSELLELYLNNHSLSSQGLHSIDVRH